MMASRPFELVCVNLMKTGMSALGMKYVVALVDHFSKWLGANALSDNSAAAVATANHQSWICENGPWGFVRTAAGLSSCIWICE